MRNTVDFYLIEKAFAERKKNIASFCVRSECKINELLTICPFYSYGVPTSLDHARLAGGRTSPGR